MLRCPPYEKKKGPGVKKAHARTKILKFCKRLEPRGLNLIYHLTNLNLVQEESSEEESSEEESSDEDNEAN
jgi:hypothetical protein